MTTFLEGKTLKEKQQFYFNGHRCIYCDKETVLVDSKVVYQESHGLIHYCKDCQAWVGTHNGSDQSFGFVAQKSLRDIRHKAHQVFDPLWQSKVALGNNRKSAQNAARKWMAEFLGITVEESHIGMFDEDQCKKLIAECSKYYLSPEQVLQKKQEAEYNVGVVYFLCAKHEIPCKDFSINGNMHFELVHKKGRVFKYKPDKNLGQWDNNAFIKIDSIEDFITENFT